MRHLFRHVPKWESYLILNPKHVVGHAYDHYCLVERKGFRLFNLVYHDFHPIWSQVVSPKLRRLMYYPAKTLSGKRLVLFDDMVGKGNQLKDAEDDLRAFLGEHDYEWGSLQRAVFAVREDFLKKPWLAHMSDRYTGLNASEYTRLSSNLRKLFFYRSMTLDIEHLEFMLEIKKEKPGLNASILEVLRDYTERPLYIAKSDQFKTAQVSVNEPNLESYQGHMVPDEFLREGVTKVRLYISEETKTIRCIPIVFFAVPEDYGPDQKGVCREWLFPFCCEDLGVWGNSGVCYDCASFNTSFELGRCFVENVVPKFRSKNINVDFAGISRVSLMVCYNLIWEKWKQNILSIETGLKAV